MTYDCCYRTIYGSTVEEMPVRETVRSGFLMLYRRPCWTRRPNIALVPCGAHAGGAFHPKLHREDVGCPSRS